MKLLLHTCCAPCSVYCIERLKEMNIEPTVYWYNPNIHPYMEYKQRRDTLKEYTKSIGINAIFEENYGLNEFCRNVIDDLENRCINYCYKVRLEKTAKYAKENGYDAFSTTLLISPYQNHEGLKKVAKEIEKKYNIEFLYEDFRPGFRYGQNKAIELGLYMQKYCGCVFSEEMSKSAHQKKDKEQSARENRDTEKRIRLSRVIPNLDFRLLKRENKEEIQFIYDLKKEVYKKYVEDTWGEWNEDIQKKIFEKYIKENSKHIKIITIKDEKIGIIDYKKQEDEIVRIENIFILPEYQNKGIGTEVLKEIIFENKEQCIELQVLKVNNRAKKLYESLGFKQKGETETHYIMKKGAIENGRKRTKNS